PGRAVRHEARDRPPRRPRHLAEDERDRLSRERNRGDRTGSRRRAVSRRFGQRVPADVRPARARLRGRCRCYTASVRARDEPERELAVYTQELFETGHDEANRAAVAAVSEDELDLVGIALRAER